MVNKHFQLVLHEFLWICSLYAVIYLDDLMILACTTHKPFASTHYIRGGSTQEI